MKTLLPLSIIPLLFSCLDSVEALRLGVHGRSPLWEDNALAVAQKRGLNVQKRSNMYTDNGVGILKNSDDISYYSYILLGGRNFSVLVDTGQPPLQPSIRFPPLLTLLSSDCRKVNLAFVCRALPWIRTDRLLFSIISSDLWVGGNVPGSTPSGQSTRIQYAVGDAQGPVMFAPLDFLGYNIPDQAFSTCIVTPIDSA